MLTQLPYSIMASECQNLINNVTPYKTGVHLLSEG